jgi:uncharacterized membrane protein
MGCCTVKPDGPKTITRLPTPLVISYYERVLSDQETKILTMKPRVLEYRARYKIFNYDLTSNATIAVLDPRLGFFA